MKIAAKVLMTMIVLLGGIYTILIWGLGQIFFSDQTNGSLIYQNNKVIGSKLLSQKTESTHYFWPRPSAADYGTIPSGASNQGPTSMVLKRSIEQREKILREAHRPDPSIDIPADLLMASGSGLDPHISPEAARFQISRVSEARNLNHEQIQKLHDSVEAMIEQPQWGFLGNPRVNVLLLNLELDRAFPRNSR